MNKFRRTLRSFLVLCFVLGAASAAQAQATRTFVSGVGNDADPCSRTAPCRTFSGALIKTFINGEINALDPGGYGTLNTTKSITIDGIGTMASMLSSGTTGVIVNIAVNANDPHRQVRLRNLIINGTGPSGTVGTRTGVDGIRVVAGDDLFVENCVITTFTQSGIEVTAVNNNFNLYIRDSVIRDNTLDGLTIRSPNSSFFARATIDNTSFSDNQNGINGGANSRVSAERCTFAGNSNAGVLSRSATAGMVAVVNVSNSHFSNNLTHGAQAGGGTGTSIVRLNRNIITGSGTSGVNIGALGQIDTYGNNQIFGNNIEGCPGCTPVPAPNT